MTTDYTPLLGFADEHVDRLLPPEDAIKLFTRVRKVSFFVRLGVEAITSRNVEEGTYSAYPASDNLKISAAQAVKILKDVERANEGRARNEKPVGLVKVSRYGDCLFLG